MNFAFIDFLLATGAVAVALAVAGIGTLGLIVWIAGGKSNPRPDRANRR